MATRTYARADAERNSDDNDLPLFRVNDPAGPLARAFGLVFTVRLTPIVECAFVLAGLALAMIV